MPRSGFHLHQHEQSLWRHAQPPAAGGTGKALGNRLRPRLRARHRRNDVHRPDQALVVRRIESRGGRAGAGIRALFWDEDRVFPRRLSDRTGPCRDGIARLPRLPDALHGDRQPYRVFGYKGKQVRDNIHSHDLVEAFWQFFHSRAPARSTTSAAAATPIAPCSRPSTFASKSAAANEWTYEEDNRIGDHIWWISDVRKFQGHYPAWKFRYNLPGILGKFIKPAWPVKPCLPFQKAF